MWKEIQQSLYGPTATTHGHSFQYLGDQHEQSDDQRREELTYRQCSDDGDAHRQFHRHTSVGDGFDGFAQNRIHPDGCSDDPHDTDLGPWFPYTEADYSAGKCDNRNACKVACTASAPGPRIIAGQMCSIGLPLVATHCLLAVR
jgi:hypothetical protein